jgi:hypothetical protein
MPQINRSSDAASSIPIERQTASAEHTQINSESDRGTESNSAPSDQPSESIGGNTGSGVGRTEEKSAAQTNFTGAISSDASSTGELATGGGAATMNGTAGKSGSTPTADSHTNQPAPPWKASDWHSSQRRADEQIRNGQVPDAYRDLVRDYFAR